MSQPGHNFHKSVLREYDIRGIVGTTLDVKDAAAIGRAYGSMVREKGGTTVVGRLSANSEPSCRQATFCSTLFSFCVARSLSMRSTAASSRASRSSAAS